MTAWLAVLAALGESACAALSGTLQHKTARRNRTHTTTPTGQLATFARRLVGQPLWWTALGVQAAALLLHATALQLGPLTLVQPVVATVVVLALPLNHLMNRSRITPAEMVWATLVTAGLAGFLLVAAPAPGAGPITAHRIAVPAIAATGTIASCVLLARRGSPRTAALALGSASGLAFTVEAALLQGSTTRLLHDPLMALTDPSLYGFIVAGITGVVLTQLAYRAGPISAALPAIITVNALASVLLGVLVAGDQIRATPVALVVEAASFACLAVAVTALSRFPDATLREVAVP